MRLLRLAGDGSVELAHLVRLLADTMQQGYILVGRSLVADRVAAAQDRWEE